MEGGMIIVAAVAIIVQAAKRWVTGAQVYHLQEGTIFTLATAIASAVLGIYLVSVGRQTKSLVLEANGKHVLTDSWTSFGLVAGLLLVLSTGLRGFDALMAVGFALNILWWGVGLCWQSASGLLDYADPAFQQKLQETLASVCSELGMQSGVTRFRANGHHIVIDLDLVFDSSMPLKTVHELSSTLQERLKQRLGVNAEITTHAEPVKESTEL